MARSEITKPKEGLVFEDSDGLAEAFEVAKMAEISDIVGPIKEHDIDAEEVEVAKDGLKRAAEEFYNGELHPEGVILGPEESDILLRLEEDLLPEWDRTLDHLKKPQE